MIQLPFAQAHRPHANHLRGSADDDYTGSQNRNQQGISPLQSPLLRTRPASSDFIYGRLEKSLFCVSACQIAGNDNGWRAITIFSVNSKISSLSDWAPGQKDWAFMGLLGPLCLWAPLIHWGFISMKPVESRLRAANLEGGNKIRESRALDSRKMRWEWTGHNKTSYFCELRRP